MVFKPLNHDVIETARNSLCNGDGETCEILVLAVLPEYEGRGIGSKLLAHVVEWLRSVGFNTWLISITARLAMVKVAQ
jgi:GNAT superfamily N-acetyltransferase